MLTAGRGWLAVGAKVAVGATVGVELGAMVGADVGAPELELVVGADEGAVGGAGGNAGASTAAIATPVTAIFDSTPSTSIAFTPASERKVVALVPSENSSFSSSSNFS